MHKSNYPTKNKICIPGLCISFRPLPHTVTFAMESFAIIISTFITNPTTIFWKTGNSRQKSGRKTKHFPTSGNCINCARVWNLRKLTRNILKNKQRELYARVESRGIIYLLLAEFLHQAQPKTYVADERITRVLAYIRTHLNAKPDIEALAALSCLSKDHLIRIFKREMRMTPLCYINKKRMEKAQLRLVTELTPIKEIAYQLGFEDQAYFNRIFKKTTGLTPMNYRKAYHNQTL